MYSAVFLKYQSTALIDWRFPTATVTVVAFLSWPTSRCKQHLWVDDGLIRNVRLISP